MKFLKYLLLLFVFFITTHVIAQVNIKGNFALGDTSQVHRLTTHNGDVYTGFVESMEAPILKFIYRSNALEFKLEDVKLIEVVESNPEPEINIASPDSAIIGEQMSRREARDYIWHFDYKITDKDERDYMGKLTKLSKYAASIEKKPKHILLDYYKISKIQLIGKRITSNPFHLLEYHRLITKKGDHFIGQLISYSTEEIVFLLKNGSEITIAPKDLSKIVLEKQDTGPSRKKRRKYNYKQHRIYFSPSALMLKEGVTEFRSNMVLYNTIEHGITNNVTVGGGFFSILLVNAVTGKIKLGFSLTDMIHVAVGAQGGVGFTFYDGGYSMGLFYGVLSIGTSDRFINVSVGRGKGQDDNMGTTGYSMGGSFRMGEHWRINVEYFHFEDPYYSYYDPTDNIFGTLGLSWSKRQHQVDFGIFISNELTETRGFPLAAYNFKF